MKIWKITFLALCLVGSLLAAGCGKETSAGKLSAGLDVLASQTRMVKTGLVNNDISFVAEDFERALNLSAVSSITITSLPSRADGVLYLGSGEVSVGQTISRANLGYLSFSFEGEGIQDSAFCFSADGSYEMECGLYLVEKPNYSPTVSTVSEMYLQVSTYKDITVYGTLSAYDPEGDAVTYEIVSRPEKGILVLEDPSVGTYRYIPEAGYTGKEAFQYVAIDRYGNYSEAATVTLSVKSSGGRLVFSDLEDSAFHVPAISLAEAGIMASTEMGGSYYFYPDQNVSRLEFLVMAMKTMGTEISYASQRTVFADDGEIPKELRGYVNTAERLGYVCGKIDEGGNLIFAPDAPITTAEAAVILANMTGMEVPSSQPVFADGSQVPAWAADAVYTMTASGILGTSGGSINATVTLNRGQTAQMLYALSQLCDQ